MLKKRIRASNFNVAEEVILIQCILRHATIIENKKTDAYTIKEKQRVWDVIENEFNSLCPNVARQSKALKDKYTNIKTTLRKQFAAEKASRKATGGGKEIPELRPRNEAMAELAKLLSISIHDTPATFHDDEDDESYGIKSPKVENVVNVDTSLSPSLSEPSTSKSWSKYTPTMLRIPHSAQLKRPISSVSSSRSEKEDSLQCLKKKLIERELEMREIEHEARMSQQQKEHEARMTLLEAQTADFKTKIELRNLKRAKLRKDKHSETETETDSE